MSNLLCNIALSSSLVESKLGSSLLKTNISAYQGRDTSHHHLRRAVLTNLMCQGRIHFVYVIEMSKMVETNVTISMLDKGKTGSEVWLIFAFAFRTFCVLAIWVLLAL